MTTQITIGVWAASIVAQLVILAMLVRHGHFRRLPLFTAWITWDMLRSVAVFSVYTLIGHDTNAYAIIFAWTEPMVLLLFAGAGLEAAGAASFGWGLAIALGFGMMIDFPVSDLPLRTQFMTRALVAGAVASALVIRSTAELLWYTSIFLLFCVIDLTTYLSIVMFWPNLDRAAVSLFVMVGQLCCLIAWAGYFRKHRGFQP